MTYFVEIENNDKGEGLVNFLRTLDFVKLIDSETLLADEQNETGLYDNTGKPISFDDFNNIIELSEQSESISIVTAIEQSGKWKNQKN
jgi:hypothetical protein